MSDLKKSFPGCKRMFNWQSFIKIVDILLTIANNAQMGRSVFDVFIPAGKQKGVQTNNALILYQIFTKGFNYIWCKMNCRGKKKKQIVCIFIGIGRGKKLICNFLKRCFRGALIKLKEVILPSFSILLHFSCNSSSLPASLKRQ